MGYKEWAEGKMRKLDVLDMKLIKWSAAAFTLMLAKLWPPLLSLEWHWYALLGALFVARPLNRAYLQGKGPQPPAE